MNDAVTCRIDTNAWDTIRALQKEGAPNLLHAIIQLYFENGPKLISTIKESVAAGDTESLHRAAHSLKSNSRYLGAYHLADLCQQLETITKTKGVAAVPATLPDEIEREYGKTVPILADEIGSGR